MTFVLVSLEPAVFKRSKFESHCVQREVTVFKLLACSVNIFIPGEKGIVAIVLSTLPIFNIFFCFLFNRHAAVPKL